MHILNNFPDLAFLNPKKMAKGMNSQKAAKKEPAKTPKEKKEEKREKYCMKFMPIKRTILQRKIVCRR